MPSGTCFNLTDKRIEIARELFAKQRGLQHVSRILGCDSETLRVKLKEMKLDHKQMQLDGLNTMKGDLYDDINDIEDTDKRAKARLDFLKHYDKSEDVAVVEDRVTNVNIVLDTHDQDS